MRLNSILRPSLGTLAVTRALIDLVEGRAGMEGLRRKRSPASLEHPLSQTTRHRGLRHKPQSEWISQFLRERSLAEQQALWFHNRTHIHLRLSHLRPVPLIHLVQGSRSIARNRVMPFLLRGENAARESCAHFTRLRILLISFLAPLLLVLQKRRRPFRGDGVAAKRACRLQERSSCLLKAASKNDLSWNQLPAGGGACWRRILPPGLGCPCVTV